MRRRNKNLRRWVAVPALASLGMALVAYGQNLMLEEVSLGAPAMAAGNAASRGAPGPKSVPGEAGGASGSVDVGVTNPEFGGQAPGSSGPYQLTPGRIRSTSQEEMVRRARENSGREDPFVGLVLPQAVAIVPVAPPAMPAPRPPQHVTVRPPSIAAPVTRINPATGRKEVQQQDGTWVEETIYANPDEPRWTVQGILNTGRESLVILEQDGVTYEAHIGEVLNDGSKVVAISGSQVTLLSRGKRYVKTIGGLEPQ